jgi:hypothetical protein
MNSTSALWSRTWYSQRSLTEIHRIGELISDDLLMIAAAALARLDEIGEGEGDEAVTVDRPDRRLAA